MSERKVVRGGSSYGDRRNVRCTCRNKNDPDYLDGHRGFRIVVNRVQREPTHRVVRGGSFNFHRVDARSAFLHSLTLYIRYLSYGFRVVVNGVRRNE